MNFKLTFLKPEFAVTKKYF